MKVEIKQILDMRKERKVNHEEAINLIDALKSTEKEGDEQIQSVINK